MSADERGDEGRAARIDRWLEALEARHLADLTFPEVSRALRALSSTYVERRRRLQEGAALSGAGKRAAFALFYGPLHFLLVRAIAQALPRVAPPTEIVDLGCGTGAAGAAWALTFDGAPSVQGIDSHPWALEEAAWTYGELGLSSRTVRRDLSDRKQWRSIFGEVASAPSTRGSAPRPSHRSRRAFLAAFSVNELNDAVRPALLETLLARAGQGDRVLIVEPLARRALPWWPAWQTAFEARGGRADEWRFRVTRPAIVAKLDRAAGLDHRELTGRSLYLAG